MAGYFIQVPITVDPAALADAAVAALEAKWVGWEPNEGDVEVVMIETLAPMASAAAETAARVPGSIFRGYGQTLLGIPYEAGLPARTTATFGAADLDGHTIPLGTEVDVDGYAFKTTVSAVIPGGADTVAGVSVEAMVIGTEANELAGVDVAPISALEFLSSVSIDAPTAGGVDPDDDEAYQDRLVIRLQLQAETLVTPRDYELMGMADASVGRILALHDGERTVAVYATDPSGNALAAPVKARLQAKYAGYRLVNTVVTMNDPTYTTVVVAWTAKGYAGYDLTDLQNRVNAALVAVLNPLAHGIQKTVAEAVNSQWFNDKTIRKFKVIDLIGDVEGINYVTAVTLSGAGATVEANGDLTMPGTVALPSWSSSSTGVAS